MNTSNQYPIEEEETIIPSSGPPSKLEATCSSKYLALLVLDRSVSLRGNPCGARRLSTPLANLLMRGLWHEKKKETER